MLITLPEPRATMCRPASWQNMNTLSRFSAIALCQPSGRRSITGAMNLVPPALLTSTSIEPSSSMVRVTHPRTSSSFVTSVVIAIARRPSPSILPASCSISDLERPAAQLHRVVDVLGGCVSAFEHPCRVVDVWEQQRVDDESSAVGAHDRVLAKLAREREHRVGRLFARAHRLHDLDQLHHRRGVEEV